MKAWIPLVAGLTFSGVMLVAVWLEEPAPVVLPELAPAPPPPPPPAPLVRAVAPPPRVDPAPEELPSPQPAAAAETVAARLSEPEEHPALDPDTASPRLDPAEGPVRSAELRLRKSERVNQLLQRRQEKLMQALATAREAGDTQAEQKAQQELDRSNNRLKAIQAQRERLKSQLTTPPIQ